MYPQHADTFSSVCQCLVLKQELSSVTEFNYREETWMGMSRRGVLLPQAAVIVPSGSRNVQEKIPKVLLKLEGPSIAKPASVGEQVANR